MKDYHKNPNFYYIIIPVLTVFWLLFVSTSALPKSKQELKKTFDASNSAEDLIIKILQTDPDRLNYKNEKGKSSEFDYTTAIDQFAKLCGIAPSKYSYTGGRDVKRSGMKTKSADVSINDVDIETLAKFLSTILIRWPDLKCDLIKLTKLNTGKDNWKVALKFTYYY
jgi:hypothetical protein